MVREVIIFAVLNGVGLLIQDATVAVNYYLLQLGHNKLAGFIALNSGIALATVFRFWSYQRFVWVVPPASTAGHTGGRPPQTAPDPHREGSHRHSWQWASMRAGMPGGQAQAHPGTVMAPLKALPPSPDLKQARMIPVAATDPDEWWQALEVNLRGPLYCTRAVLPGMLAGAAGGLSTFPAAPVLRRSPCCRPMS